MSVGIRKSLRTRCTCDKIEPMAACIKNAKFKIIKTRTGCHYVGHLQQKPKLATQNLRLGRKRPAGWT